MNSGRDIFNLKILNIKLVGCYDLPEIAPCFAIPQKIIPFNYVKSCKNPKDYFVHFYIDDYQFERVWNKPQVYLQLLSKFAGVIGPDFSVYKNMPKAQQIWQIYKQRLLTAYWQQNGLIVIPNISWSNENDSSWIFEGLPKNSVVAISSNGCLKQKVLNHFITGYEKTIKELHPTKIIFVGRVPEQLYKDNLIKSYDSFLSKFNKRKNK